MTMARVAPSFAPFALLAACGGGDAPGYEWDLPEGFPRPRVPEDNPMSLEKVVVECHLFYDVRLSGNEMQS